MSESVILETSLGDIQLELYWNHAPKVCYYNYSKIAELIRPIDLQKLLRAHETRVLQWRDIPPHHIRMLTFIIHTNNVSFILRIS